MTSIICATGYGADRSSRGSPAAVSSRPAAWGWHRWVMERAMSWLNGCRRLHRRYERTADHFLAFVGIACTLICYRRAVRV
jgi:hypothetical protein